MASDGLERRIPPEVKQKITNLDKILSEVEERLKPFLDIPHNELIAELSPLDKAKADLVAAYSINSLFWMYLNICGVNPKDHGIKQELDRIRSYMNRVKEIQDKALAPKIDVKATKRFVKSALWQAAHNKKEADATTSKESPSDWNRESVERKKKKRKRDDV
ncbi:hypothetical protein CHS0354_015764 [Potamilus streckersoni]|uniref:Nuclear nucleic acid-binding protein C1D n=1 Tax=Potamilus streckersoni TaxID=2493646 RepID=A0AAE0T3G1_9BIVA|nr:hypothetical protein CHS0354_015764 [Potamilus streckersoni]